MRRRPARRRMAPQVNTYAWSVLSDYRKNGSQVTTECERYVVESVYGRRQATDAHIGYTVVRNLPLADLRGVTIFRT